MKILIWGAGSNGNLYRRYIEKFTKDEFAGFVDNNSRERGVKHPSEMFLSDFDLLVVSNQSLKDRQEIRKQLKELDVADSKVVFLVEDEELKTKVFSYVNRYDEKNDMRVVWLGSFAHYANLNSLPGNVAECGVNRGEFAYYINKFFSAKKLYLFDTFDGFADDDLKMEKEIADDDFLDDKFVSSERFQMANLDMMKKRMIHLNKCEFRIGYFPDSAQGIDDQFCFVNLDMDLYKPTLAGLEFFYPRLVEGGVILIHDYFSEKWSGVEKAIRDYEDNQQVKLHKFPIGDYLSLAIIK